MSSLYIHIPYCDTKCLYCDFYSIENQDSKNNFINSLLKEVSSYSNFYSEEEVETIFFGGGTPSLLSPFEIEKILNSIYKNFKISKTAEVTLEANPGTVSLEKLNGYRLLGVNRLSFGVQSFNDDELKFLSRIHTSQEARESIKLACKAGFENINLDLMFSLPNQTKEKLSYTLKQALSFETKHISTYSLIVEPNTPLFNLVKNKIVTPLATDDDAELYKFTLDELLKNGYKQYEVSNFCKPGFFSRHNTNYWNHTNYIGFGPSAHSFWKTNLTGAKRWSNHRSVLKYCQDVENGKLPVFLTENLNRQELIEESIFLGLRSQGVDVKKFQNNYGIDILTDYSSKIKNLISNNFMKLENNLLCLTKQGYMLCDSISESFI